MTQKLEGKQAICDYMHWSLSKFNRKKNLLEAAGYLFRDIVGSPPQKMLCAWDTDLRRYTALKGSKKEFI